jgi:pimeloyl-ACP methyl ester carboxylesterase
MFLNEGYAVLLPDSRAHGVSEGQFVTYGLLEKFDVVAWANWMKRTGCHKLYGLGESLGAPILIQAAAIEPAFAAIVAESPYADLREIAEYRVRRMSGLPAITHASTPILLIHGLNAFRTPAWNSQKLARANPQNPLWLVPNAGHRRGG